MNGTAAIATQFGYSPRLLILWIGVSPIGFQTSRPFAPVEKGCNVREPRPRKKKRKKHIFMRNANQSLCNAFLEPRSTVEVTSPKRSTLKAPKTFFVELHAHKTELRRTMPASFSWRRISSRNLAKCLLDIETGLDFDLKVIVVV